MLYNQIFYLNDIRGDLFNEDGPVRPANIIPGNENKKLALSRSQTELNPLVVTADSILAHSSFMSNVIKSRAHECCIDAAFITCRVLIGGWASSLVGHQPPSLHQELLQ